MCWTMCTEISVVSYASMPVTDTAAMEPSPPATKAAVRPAGQVFHLGEDDGHAVLAGGGDQFGLRPVVERKVVANDRERRSSRPVIGGGVAQDVLRHPAQSGDGAAPRHQLLHGD